MPIRLRCRLVSLDRQSGAQSVFVTPSDRHLVDRAVHVGLSPQANGTAKSQ
jgi:hypothetical protein